MPWRQLWVLELYTETLTAKSNFLKLQAAMWTEVRVAGQLLGKQVRARWKEKKVHNQIWFNLQAAIKENTWYSLYPLY